LIIPMLSKDMNSKSILWETKSNLFDRNNWTIISRFKTYKDKKTRHIVFSNPWREKAKTSLRESENLKTPDQTNLKLKPYANNCKRKKGKVWVCKNMQEKNMLNTKKFLMNKRDANNNFKSSMKDLMVKATNKNSN